MEKDEKEKAKTADKDGKKKTRTPKIKLSYADQGVEHYKELLKQKKEFDEEFKPLKAFLVKMGKLQAEPKKKKA